MLRKRKTDQQFTGALRHTKRDDILLQFNEYAEHKLFRSPSTYDAQNDRLWHFSV